MLLRLTAPATAILASQDVTETITAVTQAADDALCDDAGLLADGIPLLLLADASDAPDTALEFGAVRTRNRSLIRGGLEHGRGRQIMHVLSDVDAASPVLIVDTRNTAPSGEVYRTLLERVREGAAIAVADHPHWWDQGRGLLTDLLARPLTATALGRDVPTPLATDIALSPKAWRTVRAQWTRLSPELRSCAGGHGIAPLLLQAAATTGPVVAVRVPNPAGHPEPRLVDLPRIWRDVAPLLLNQAATRIPQTVELALPRLATRRVHAEEITARRERLADLARPGTPTPWSTAVAGAWHTIATASPANAREAADVVIDAAERLWPEFVHQARHALQLGADSSSTQRQQQRHRWATDVITAITQ
ncbi:hypothetical protein SAMN05421805_10622 [Saccharopolyspora antimicrobica]|uniref:Uncharacterized protein n=1 Tax=Saccharopolyspora antimicrobica TaxID=455193 RepID=A0A1I5AVS8_9PSEU|nr:hypothetical protein [Saccharopolyspora antimicrobica]RKT86381.1 hypothetical protein ATL45_4747 [Saccharopolyspora antimicrobica]SFN66491.1 hypothetical protein SAMN05421805_10622 [Saccharopolyspora antimicrobica]